MPYKDPKVRKEKHKIMSRNYYLKTRSETIARSAKWKKEHRERDREINKQYRRRVDPTIRIGDSLRDFSRGDIEYTEFNRRVQECVDEIFEGHETSK